MKHLLSIEPRRTRALVRSNTQCESPHFFPPPSSSLVLPSSSPSVPSALRCIKSLTATQRALAGKKERNGGPWREKRERERERERKGSADIKFTHPFIHPFIRPSIHPSIHPFREFHFRANFALGPVELPLVASLLPSSVSATALGRARFGSPGAALPLPPPLPLPLPWSLFNASAREEGPKARENHLK